MTAPPPARQEIVDRVLSRLDDLTRPQRVTTRQWTYPRGSDHLVPADVVVVHQALLVQLGQTVAGSTGGGSGAQESRPPASLAAADWLATVHREAKALAARLLTSMAVAAMPGVQVEVVPRRLVDALAVVRTYTPDLDAPALRLVDGAVRRWWVRARVLTTWDAPPLRPYVPCPACSVRGSLRVVQHPPAMTCLECTEAWEAGTVEALGEVYRLAVEEASQGTVTA